MNPDSWMNTTTLHPLGLLILAALVVLQFFVHRTYALVPMLILLCLTGAAQRIVLLGIDMNFMRIMILAAMARIAIRGEFREFRWKKLDVAFLGWAISATVMTMLLFGIADSFVYRMGLLYDWVGLYFMTRFLVRSWHEVRTLAAAAMFISIPMAGVLTFEHLTRQNLFSIFGGVPDTPGERLGRLRCQGPFIHPIIAGLFWVILAPLMATGWWRGGIYRPMSVISLIAVGFIVYLCGSATPLLGAVAGIVAASLIFVRRWMNLIHLGAAALLVVLHIAMVNPVWHLLARIQVVGGATGWYRFRLLDDFINHFSTWWLMGTHDFSTWWAGGRWSITNEYVLQGVNGGALPLALFLIMLITALFTVQRLWKQSERPRRWLVLKEDEQRGARTGPATVRANVVGLNERLIFSWAMYVILVIHAASFLAVSYFGQITFVWYPMLAIIASLAPSGKRILLKKRVPSMNIRRLATLIPNGPPAIPEPTPA